MIRFHSLNSITTLCGQDRSLDHFTSMYHGVDIAFIAVYECPGMVLHILRHLKLISEHQIFIIMSLPVGRDDWLRPIRQVILECISKARVRVVRFRLAKHIVMIRPSLVLIGGIYRFRELGE